MSMVGVKKVKIVAVDQDKIDELHKIMTEYKDHNICEISKRNCNHLAEIIDLHINKFVESLASPVFVDPKLVVVLLDCLSRPSVHNQLYFLCDQFMSYRINIIYTYTHRENIPAILKEQTFITV